MYTGTSIIVRKSSCVGEVRPNTAPREMRVAALAKLPFNKLTKRKGSKEGGGKGKESQYEE